MKLRAILLFGAPGAGKGTQGKILGQIPNFVHFSCGEAFRNLRVDSPLGSVFVEYAGQGKLVPDEPTIQLWKNSIEGMIATGRFHPEADTMLLDGIPRNPRQAQIMAELIDVKAIFNLFCPQMDKLVHRLQRRALKENRLDDANVEVIRARLDTYKRDTRAVLECYPEHLIHQIDSTQEPLLVLFDILKIVTRLPKPAISDGTTIFSKADDGRVAWNRVS
ncbi:MAG TPA: nucleoside monophosphate kinase [Verrucomicrobiota bacterium]|nr:adenylate kinase [Verrucomicrobiales bacterium]HRI13606.1 nucleoside monophosphate kinase [Verrucomicrobiota bacterium]